MEQTPIYDFADAVDFIRARCNIHIEDIERVLTLEEEYMRSVGIINDEEDDTE